MCKCKVRPETEKGITTKNLLGDTLDENMYYVAKQIPN